MYTNTSNNNNGQINGGGSPATSVGGASPQGSNYSPVSKSTPHSTIGSSNYSNGNSSTTPNISYQTNTNSLYEPNSAPLTSTNTPAVTQNNTNSNSPLKIPEPTAKGGDDKTLLKNSKAVMLVNPYYTNLDTIVAIGLMFKFLKKSGKEVHLLTHEKPNETYMNKLSEFGLKEDDLKYKLTPIAYTITLQDAKDDIEIDYEKTEYNLTFKLIPKLHEIDFTKIRFGKEGALYDLVITFNAPRLSDISSDLASRIEYQFNRYDSLVISNIVAKSKETPYTYAKNQAVDDGQYSISRYTQKYLQDNGYQLDEKDRKSVIEAIVSNSRGITYLQKYLTDTALKEEIDKSNINISRLYREFFFNKSENENKLLTVMLSNIKIDDKKKAIYSFISTEQLEPLGLNEESLKNLTHIPFNIPSKFRFAAFAYKYQDKVKVLLEGNDSEQLYTIVSKNNGYSGKYAGVFLGDSKLNLSENVKKVIEFLPEHQEASESISSKQDSSSQGSNSNMSPNSNQPINNNTPSQSNGYTPSTNNTNPTNPYSSYTQNLYSSNSSNSTMASPTTNQTNTTPYSQSSNTPSGSPSQNSTTGNTPHTQDHNTQQPTSSGQSITPNDQGTSNSTSTNPNTSNPYAKPIENNSSEFSKSPFIKSSESIVDPNAVPLKAPAIGRTSFDTNNKPFDKAEIR